MAAWVASALARRVDLWDNKLVLPPALAARAAVLAFGDELLDLELRPYRLIGDLIGDWVVHASTGWLTPGGRDLAAAYLLPPAHAALLLELQRLAAAVMARQATILSQESSSSSRSAGP
jgi:hypothetical protein